MRAAHVPGSAITSSCTGARRRPPRPPQAPHERHRPGHRETPRTSPRSRRRAPRPRLRRRQRCHQRVRRQRGDRQGEPAAARTATGSRAPSRARRRLAAAGTADAFCARSARASSRRSESQTSATSSASTTGAHGIATTTVSTHQTASTTSTATSVHLERPVVRARGARVHHGVPDGRADGDDRDEQRRTTRGRDARAPAPSSGGEAHHPADHRPQIDADERAPADRTQPRRAAPRAAAGSTRPPTVSSPCHATPGPHQRDRQRAVDRRRHDALDQPAVERSDEDHARRTAQREPSYDAQHDGHHERVGEPGDHPATGESSTRKRAQNPTSDHAHDTAPAAEDERGRPQRALRPRRRCGPVSLTSR